MATVMVLRSPEIFRACPASAGCVGGRGLGPKGLAFKMNAYEVALLSACEGGSTGAAEGAARLCRRGCERGPDGEAP